MSIDFEIPPEAKAVRERVRQWVKDECIPAEDRIKDEASYKSVLAELARTLEGPRPGPSWLPLRAQGAMAAWAWARWPTPWSRWNSAMEPPGRSLHEQPGSPGRRDDP